MDNFSAPIPESFVFFRSMTVTTNALFFVRLLREPVQERMASSQAGHDGVCSCGAGFLIARAKRGRYALAGRSAERMPLYANRLSLLKRSEGQPGCSTTFDWSLDCHLRARWIARGDGRGGNRGARDRAHQADLGQSCPARTSGGSSSCRSSGWRSPCWYCRGTATAKRLQTLAPSRLARALADAGR